MWSHKFLIQELVSSGVTRVEALGLLTSCWFVEDTEGGLRAVEAIANDGIFQMLERGCSSWATVDKYTGESLGHTQKTSYFPKSREEFFHWGKPRPLGGMNPLPASAHHARQVISCKPSFTRQQVSWLLGWTSSTAFIPSPGNDILLPSHLHEPAPSCQQTQHFSQGNFSLSYPLLPGCLPAFPAVLAEATPVPLAQRDIQEGDSKQLSPTSISTCLCM